MDVNYFVCTLGQAALPGVSRPFKDVNHLIDEQASHQPNSPAVGFYRPFDTHDTYTQVVLTFAEVKQGVQNVAEALAERLAVTRSQTIGLLCSSSPVFFFTWLSLIRLGHPALLIAPQCSASAIAHLSNVCGASVLLHDTVHHKLATTAAGCCSKLGYPELTAHGLPISDDNELFRVIERPLKRGSFKPATSSTDVVYLHHTSGTSAGIPKPIPQTNHGAVGVLPSLDGVKSATFTTTPLYHGGPADIFRAWTSNALIWLFPGQHAPITAANIIKCLDASKRAAVESQVPPIKYFSSVPYVLQMMAQEDQGLKWLQEMDLVGVGGAALPPEVGDMLIAHNVNLLSRYGSAECGFLMSSHRDYRKDKEWQYLRKSPEVRQLRFEPNEGGRSELVISSGWPHMAKTNRADGSFATADLFAPHLDIPDAWKYHSRADSQLTLVTGKKFDPSPVENSLAAASSVLSEVLIFGNGQPYPGALVFRSAIAKDSSDSEIVQQVAPIIEKLNIESHSHARISRNMLIPMPYQGRPLEKSSKGTILRGSAEEMYRQQIEQAYQQDVMNGEKVDDEDVQSALMKIVKSVVGTASHDDDDQLNKTTNLFAHGVDSIACAQIRHAMTQLLPKNSSPLPLTIVQDSGDVSSLSDVVLRVRKGETAQLHEDQEALMRELVKRYSVFMEPSRPISTVTSQNTGLTILMTGPTGSLGAHILSQLLDNPQVARIHLLIRGSTVHAARERVLKALSSRHLPIPATFTKVTVFPCKLSDPHLGLSATDYSTLTRVDTILHLAWSVDFLVSLRSLATTHLSGLQNLLNLALSSPRPVPPYFVFCSSVASVSQLPSVPETVVTDPSASGPTGYARSKLAAELICAACAHTTRLNGRVALLRVGQLSGASASGVWNTSEAYPLLLGGSKTTGVLPRLDEVLGWLPVDVAARCFVEAALKTSNGEPVRVLHLLNPAGETTWMDLLGVLRGEGVVFEVVETREWIERLERMRGEKREHPALRLLPFWKRVYGDPDWGAGGAVTGGGGEARGFEMARSLEAMPSLRNAVGPLDRAYLLRLWGWIQDNFD